MPPALAPVTLIAVRPVLLQLVMAPPAVAVGVALGAAIVALAEEHDISPVPVVTVKV